MSLSLVLVLAVAALVPLVAVRLRLPGALLEIVAGIVLGPSLLGWIRPDATINALSLLGLSFLLFLAGSEVDLRRFRGTLGKRVGASLGISVVAAGVVVAVLVALGVGGAVVIGVALMATSSGLVVPVLADSGALNRPIGRVAVAGAPAGEVAAVVLLSVGLSGRGHAACRTDPLAGAASGRPGCDSVWPWPGWSTPCGCPRCSSGSLTPARRSGCGGRCCWWPGSPSPLRCCAV